MLKRKSLIRVFLILLVILGSFWGFARNDLFNNIINNQESNAVFIPGLIERLTECDKIILETSDNELEFIKENDDWQLLNGYPVNKRLINNLLLELCNLKLLEKKTANPDKLENLQLSGNNLIKITLSSQAQDKNIVELIVGKNSNVTIGDEATSKTFVRHADSNQAYLVLGNISISTDLVSWIEQPLSPLGSSKNVRKLTIFDKQQEPAVFFRFSPEASFALINNEHNFNHVNLNNFLSDLLAIECHDVVPKSFEVLKHKNILGFSSPNSLNSAYYNVSQEKEKDIKIIIETFDDIQYTFQIRSFGEQVIAQIESSFVRKFPSEYPLILKPIQQTMATLPIREQYIFKLSKKDFNSLDSSQEGILNG